MKLTIYFSLLCTLACTSLYSASLPPAESAGTSNAPVEQSDVQVKILLDCVSTDKPIKLTFNSEQKLFVTFNTQPDKKYVTKGPITLDVKSDGNNLVVHAAAKKSYMSAPTIVIAPESGHLELDGRRYAGSIILHIKDKSLYVVNKLPLERYVYGVLKTESWPGWPLEVNKALAIAIRTYALHMIAKLEHKAPLFHLRNTSAHQTYNGHHETPVHQRAVEETLHMFISYNNEPIIAMYDACCGGIIPAHIKNHFDSSKAPYLKRTQRCIYCEGSRSYRWSKDLSITDLETCLKKFFPKLNGLREIKVTQTDKAGIVQKVRLRDKRRNYELSGKKLYELCDKKIRSFAFSVSKIDGAFRFEGKGIGHHTGMCQWGALGMVNQGMSYRDILKFYYPGTDLKIIKTKHAPHPQKVHQLTEITSVEN